MKIVLCNNNLAGLYLFRRDIVRHFAESGHEVLLLFPYTDATKDDGYEAFLSRHARCIPIPMQPNSQSVFEDFRLYRILRRIYRREHPDIVFNFTVKPNIYSALAAHHMGSRVVDMMPGLGYVFIGDSLKKRVMRRLYRWGLHASDRVIVLNQHSYDTVVDRYVDRSKLILFPGGEGVNMEEYPYRENRFSTTTFLMIARLLYDKGVKEFIDAAACVRQTHPNVRFELLGDLSEDSPTGVPRASLEAAVREGHVAYLGTTDDVPSIVLRDGIVVVIPSYYMEGMNRALMEACAMGRPIITTDMPGCKEMVSDGLTGYCIPPRSAQALADACLRFLGLSEPEKQAMSRASYEKCRNQFNVRLVIEAYERIISELISNLGR